MSPILFGTWLQYVFGISLFVTSVFLILLVLVQRGRGGGLAGAFGGMGGQSAFGTKAGDLFTRITIVVASFWILLCVLAIAFMNTGGALGPAGDLTVAPADEFEAPAEGMGDVPDGPGAAPPTTDLPDDDFPDTGLPDGE
jgi:preprotein translocase subunit SecG